MKEKDIEEDIIINENLKIELKFFDSKIYLSINEDYFDFLTKICDIIKIAKEDVTSIILSYIDDDEDTIIISAKGDYEIFYQQVKDNLVKKLELKINENSKLDADECFANFFNYIEQNENKDFNINNSSNNKIKDDKDNKNNNKMKEEEINKIIVINQKGIDSDSDEEKNDNNIQEDFKIIDDYFNYNKNNKNDYNEEIFDCECSSCKEYPIFTILFYCTVCDIYLCSKCEKNASNHIHPILKIETQQEFINAICDNYEIVKIPENIEQKKDKKRKFRLIPKCIKDWTKKRVKQIWKKEEKINNNQ